MCEKWAAALEAMDNHRKKIGITGVAGIAQKNDDGTIDIQLKDCGQVFNDWGNLYAVACSKLMEMVRTGLPSGTLTPLAGEFSDFVGGTLDGNLYVTFTGAAGHLDLEVAKVGLNLLQS